jgi:hypothetical protein
VRSAPLANQSPPLRAAGAFPSSSAAPMALPEPRPPECPASRHHGAGDVAGLRGDAPCCCAATSGIANGHAAHRRPLNPDVALGALARRHAQELHQRIPCGTRVRHRAGLIVATGAIHLPRCNARQADPWTLGAPNWPITIPHTHRGADEGLAGWNDGGAGG